MWQKFTLNDLRIIGHYLGILVLFFSFLCAVPLCTAFFCNEWEAAQRYLFAMGFSMLIGSALRFLRIHPGRLSRRQALAVTGFSWIVLALFASIPLYLSGHFASVLDAIFDGVSGITTTGCSVMVDVNHLSNADNMFRFMQHLLGGLGLIVVALSLGLFGKSGSMSLYVSEGRSEHVLPNIVQTARLIGRIALTFIVIAAFILFILCILVGMEPTRALLHGFWLSISGFMTGGMTPMRESIMYYHSFPIELVLMVLMIAGSINFVLYLEIWKGNVRSFLKDLEVKTMVIWLVVITFVLAASLSASTLFSALPGLLRRGVFSIVAAFSTTGFLNITANELTTVFTSGALLVLAVAMAVGGGVGSTAGGMKLQRLGIMFKSIVAAVKEALAPDSARVAVSYSHLGRQRVSEGLIKEAMTVFVLFIVTYIIGALAGIAFGYDATQSFVESVAMASNGGISIIASPGMPVGLEVVYIFEMWAGRLEFVTLLAVLVEVFISITPRRRRKE